MDGKARSAFVSALVALFILGALTGCASTPITPQSLASASSNGAPAPADLAANNEPPDGAHLTWTPVASARGYEIQSAIGDSEWTLLTESLLDRDGASNLGGYSFDSGLGRDLVSFRIRAVFDANTTSEWSDKVTIVGRSAIPDQCLSALRSAAEDLAGTAEEAFRVSAESCETAQIWAAAAWLNPDAVGYVDPSPDDVAALLDSVCFAYSSTPVCLDYARNGLD